MFCYRLHCIFVEQLYDVTSTEAAAAAAAVAPAALLLFAAAPDAPRPSRLPPAFAPALLALPAARYVSPLTVDRLAIPCPLGDDSGLRSGAVRGRRLAPRVSLAGISALSYGVERQRNQEVLSLTPVPELVACPEPSQALSVRLFLRPSFQLLQLCLAQVRSTHIDYS